MNCTINHCQQVLNFFGHLVFIHDVNWCCGKISVLQFLDQEKYMMGVAELPQTIVLFII